MDFSIFGRGWLLGLAIAAPVGPIGILCIKRSLTQGWRFGLASGLGAATADGLYGCIAGFGLVTLSQFLVTQQFWLRLGGGAFLLYLGIRTLCEAFTQPTSTAANLLQNNQQQEIGQQDTARDDALGAPLFAAYGSTLLLTLTNPITILSFTAIFAGMGATATSQLGAGLLVSGVFSGSACWWLLLCGGVSLLRQRITAGQLRWISGASAGVLIVFGVSAIATVFS